MMSEKEVSLISTNKISSKSKTLLAVDTQSQRYWKGEVKQKKRLHREQPLFLSLSLSFSLSLVKPVSYSLSCRFFFRQYHRHSTSTVVL